MPMYNSKRMKQRPLLLHCRLEGTISVTQTPLSQELTIIFQNDHEHRFFVNWNPQPWPSVGEAVAAQRTPDLSNIIQEIVDHSDWKSGNALSIIITGTGKRVAKSFNNDPESGPLLHVQWMLPNQPPITVADPEYSTSENKALNISTPGLLGNDTDPEGAPLTAVLDKSPSNAASFTLNSDGSFEYIPGTNFIGIDSFDYHASDGTDPGNSITVIINVIAQDVYGRIGSLAVR